MTDSQLNELKLTCYNRSIEKRGRERGITLSNKFGVWGSVSLDQVRLGLVKFFPPANVSIVEVISPLPL